MPFPVFSYLLKPQRAREFWQEACVSYGREVNEDESGDQERFEEDSAGAGDLAKLVLITIIGVVVLCIAGVWYNKTVEESKSNQAAAVARIHETLRSSCAFTRLAGGARCRVYYL